VIATQHQRQLSSDLLAGPVANAASLISFRAALQDARDVSLRMGSYPMVDLTRLPSFLAAATLSLSGTPTEAFTLQVDYNDRLRRRRETRRSSRRSSKGRSSDSSIPTATSSP
jgi:hypothetical protein